MKRSLCILLSLLVASLVVVSAQEVTQIEVPKINQTNDKAPAVAVNRQGNMMVIYRNGSAGMMYYYKKKNGTTKGPGTIQANPYVQWSSIVATRDGKFHAVWNVMSGATGVYYSVFDPASESWTTPSRIVAGTVEDPHIRVNPKTDEMILCWCWQFGINKEIYIKVMSENRDVKISTNPFSDTNPYAYFDENGTLYVTWKEDRENPPGSDNWELVVTLAMMDSNYNRVFKDELTWEYSGWHFLPTMAMVKNKGFMAFAWSQQAGYYYQTLEKVDNTIKYDAKGLKRIAAAPISPWYYFHSKAVGHGDKIYYAYRDGDGAYKMLVWQDGQWLNSGRPIVLTAQAAEWPWDFISNQNGIYLAWYTTVEPSKLIVSFYPDKLIVVSSATNVTHTHITDASLFSKTYLNTVSWKNNAYNVENEVVLSKYVIYRKLKTQGLDGYTKLAEVAPSVTTYEDTAASEAEDLYDYYVTCVDESGNESAIETEGSSSSLSRESDKAVSDTLNLR